MGKWPAWKKFLARSIVVVFLVGIRTLLHLNRIDWWGNAWLIVGWTVGYFLTDIDDLFYVYICNPQELTCQRVRAETARGKWLAAWQILISTRPERQKLPVHNIVTGLATAAVGVWIVSSSGSLIAAGAVLGLSVRLLIGLMLEKDFNKWYWMFAREFTAEENRILKLIWMTMIAAQLLVLVRG